MADTTGLLGIAKGLLGTREKYLAAFESGETDLSHKDWYEAGKKAEDALWQKVKKDRQTEKQASTKS